MSKLLLSITLFIIGCASAPTPYTEADFNLSGKWKAFWVSGAMGAQGKNDFAIAEFYEENGSHFANTTLLTEPFDASGKPKVYTCSEFQGQSYIGISWLRNLKKEGGIYSGGQMHDHNDCTWLSVEITPVSKNEIIVRGYLGLKMLGKQITWTRAGEEYDKLVNEKLQPANTVKPTGILALGTVFQVEGKKITVLSKSPSKVRMGLQVFFLDSTGNEIGSGTIQTVQHTNFKLNLTKGNVSKGNQAVFYLKL